jgi:hypothetical protein
MGWRSVWTFLGRHMLLPLTVLGLAATAFMVYEVNRERDNQRGIDAHPGQVTAAVTGAGEGFGLYSRSWAVVDFTANGQRVTSAVHGLPADAADGGAVCVEYDQQRPTRVRLCGTRGGLDDAWTRLFVTGGVTVGFFALWLVYAWRRRAARAVAVGAA